MSRRRATWVYNMADSNDPDTARQNELAQDDPFAELMRIMTHEPPAPDTPPSREAPAAEPADDFALELENELIGGDRFQGDVTEEDGLELPEPPSVDHDPLAGPQSAEVVSESREDPDFENTLQALLEGAFEENPLGSADVAESGQVGSLGQHPQEPNPAAEFTGSEPILPVTGAEQPRDDWQGAAEPDVQFAETDFQAELEASLAASATEQPHVDDWQEASQSFDGAEPAAQSIDPDFQAELEASLAASAIEQPQVDDWQEASRHFDAAEPEAQSIDPDFQAELEASLAASAVEQPHVDDWQEASHSFDVAKPDVQFAEQDFQTEDTNPSFDESEPVAGQDAAFWSDEPEGAVGETPAHRDSWPVAFTSVAAAHAVDSSRHEASASAEIAPAGFGRNQPPDVDTVDIPEEAVPVADNLDVPEISYHDEVKSAGQLDEIEEILAGAFGETSDPISDTWAETKAFSFEDEELSTAEEDGQDRAPLGAAAAFGAAAATASGAAYAGQGDDQFGFERAWARTNQGAATLAPAPGTEPPVDSRRSRFSTPVLIGAAVLAGVVVVGGAGALMTVSFSDGDGGEPVIVAADDAPIRVKPDDPGGVVIPNQDNQVYKRVSGEQTEDSQPEQTQLISSMEEPIDLPGVQNAALKLPSAEETSGRQSETDIATTKIEDRLARPVAEEGGANEDTVVQPHRVRTFVVRADGTMVPREMPQPQQSAENDDAVTAELAQTAPNDGAETTSTPAVNELAERAALSIPQNGPIPPARPANNASASAQQPQNPEPAGQQNTQPQQEQQVAAVANPATQVTSTPSSEWSVQIASQPTVEGAQQSYQQLAQRFGSMLQGKGVNIVKADIEGKGTYYRVRIPSASKDEAIELCSDLKSAGGSCFVSQ